MTVKLMNMNDSTDTEQEGENLQCELCGHISEDFDSYIDHTGPGDCVSYCNQCDKTFILESDLKKQTEKYC